MEYQVIVGIVIDGKTMDYCREQVHADTPPAAISKAFSMVESAPKPPHGKLFVRSVENWNAEVESEWFAYLSKEGAA